MFQPHTSFDYRRDEIERALALEREQEIEKIDELLASYQQPKLLREDSGEEVSPSRQENIEALQEAVISAERQRLILAVDRAISAKRYRYQLEESLVRRLQLCVQ